VTDKAGQLLKVNDVLAVDEEHGIVVGWAIVCTKDGQPYYDLNVDRDGVRKGERVPEHITKSAVIKALIDAAQVGVMAGNEMHEGPETGQFVGMFYMDADIAKSLGMTTTTEGLLVQYKPEPEVLAKFKNGTYTGFSIEGARVEFEEIEEAA